MKITVVDHPLVQHKLSYLRDKETPTVHFRKLVNEVTLLLTYEATKDFPTEPVEIETPLETMQAQGGTPTASTSPSAGPVPAGPPRSGLPVARHSSRRWCSPRAQVPCLSQGTSIPRTPRSPRRSASRCAGKCTFSVMNSRVVMCGRARFGSNNSASGFTTPVSRSVTIIAPRVPNVIPCPA